MQIARAGHRCARARAAALTGLGPVSTRCGPGWVAARTGALANDLNVVVGEPGFVPGSGLVDDLVAWFGDAPASWLASEPDDALTAVLVSAGAAPERTGRWCGRPVTGAPGDPAGVRPAGPDDLGQWLDVAEACGWYDGRADRATRAGLARAWSGDPRRASFLAWQGDRAVGLASGWCDGEVVEVVDVAVLPQARRAGRGRDLVAAVVAWGAGRGADQVVAAPSPDGWRLMRSLGFDNVPVEPDVCLYLPVAAPA